MGRNARYDAASAPPGWQQYLDLKRQRRDELLLVRQGDFYEAYSTPLGDDADRLVAVLGVQLTRRTVRGVDYPMAGIPCHALDAYLARLVAAGLRVAIADQMEDPATVRGRPVERAVTRILSAGTLRDDALLAARRPSVLATLARVGERTGVAYADVSTGEFACTEFAGDPVEQEARALAELSRLEPAEVLLPEGQAPLALPGEVVYTPRPPEAFRPSDLGRARLLHHFGVASLHGYDLEDAPAARVAAEAIFDYLLEMAPSGPPQLDPPRRYSLDGTMTLDAQSRRSLELFASLGGDERGSLLALLDETVSAPGGRLLRRWLAQPLASLGPLRERQARVARLHGDPVLRARLRDLLADVGDLERASQRLAARTLTPRQAAALVGHLEAAAMARALLLGAGSGERADDLPDRQVPLPDLPDLEPLRSALADALAPDPPASFGEGGVIRPGYDPDLDALIAAGREDREWLLTLEARERQRTGIKSLKLGWNQVLGYYLEVTRPNLHLVPDDYERRASVAGAERFTTAGLLDRERRLRESNARIAAREQVVYQRLLAEASAHVPRLRELARGLAELDALAALAEVAARRGYSRPVLDESLDVVIEGGRHPLVESAVEHFVPNDVHLDGKSRRCALVFGPNMGGKSTYLRMVALVVLMAQMGSFVPARAARIGLVDRIFTRIGAHDELARGRSTFMLEMEELATILHYSTPRSLALLDEVGRGTSTSDGLAICQAVVEYLHDHPTHRPRTLLATHFHEMASLADGLPAVVSLQATVAEDDGRVVFLHRIAPGASDRTYGVHVARLAGVPTQVLRRAEELLASGDRRPPPAPLPESYGARRGDADRGVGSRSVAEGLAPSATDVSTRRRELNEASPAVGRAERHSPPVGQAGAASSADAEASARLLAELRRLNLANLTPLAALNLLARWRDEVDGQAERRGDE